MKIFTFGIFITLLFFQCSSDKTSTQKDSIAQNNIDTVSETNQLPEPELKEVAKVDSISSDSQVSLYENYNRLKQMHDQLPYFLPYDSNYLFVTVMGEWSDHKTYSKPPFLFQMGLINDKNEPVLPIRFHHLGNPGIYDNHWIEIKQNKNKGLFNLKSNQLISPAYDVIYPMKDLAVIAIAKKGDELFTVDLNGEINEITDINDKIGFMALQQGSVFNIYDKSIVPYYTTHIFYSDEEQPFKKFLMDFEEGIGTVYSPLYLSELNAIKPQFNGLEVQGQKSENVYFSVSEGKSIVSNIYELTNDIKAFFTSFVESGTSSRGYFIEQERLITLNRRNELIDSTLLTENYEGRYLQSEESFNVIGDSLIEIVKGGSSFLEYIYFPEYSYKQILPDGKIKSFNSRRQFAFTRFVRIDPGYFKHTLFKENKEGVTGYVDGDFNLLRFEHFSIEDLDIMRNEIFAEYGYRFKTEKWKKYFSQKIWYEPLFDNVDDQLSEIEKYNIKIILEVKAKLLENPDELIQKEAVNYGPPA